MAFDAIAMRLAMVFPEWRRPICQYWIKSGQIVELLLFQIDRPCDILALF